MSGIGSIGVKIKSVAQRFGWLMLQSGGSIPAKEFPVQLSAIA